MTVQQMLNALPVLQKVMELKLPLKKAYKVFTLAKAIEDKRQFFVDAEKKLVSTYEGEILENGSIKFQSSETQRKFAAEHAELLNWDVEDFTAIELSFDDLGDATFTAKDLMALEGVINFVE